MATEQFANNPQTTLSAAVAVGDLSIGVTTGSGFPSSAQYRIRIDNEILIVTGGAGTTTWTVTRGAEGTVASSHCIGVVVTHILTAGALANLDAGYIATGVVAIARGGTNSGSPLTNNQLMTSKAGAIVELGAMSNGQLPIGSTGSAPSLATLTPGTGIAITNAAGSITIGGTVFGASGTSHTAGDVPDPGATAGTTRFLREDATWAVPPGIGTVTSVALSTNASWYTVSGSPVTTSGTLTFNLTTGQTANQVLATPNGTTGTVGLRTLVAADIPALDASQITTGTLPIARGGTNSATPLNNNRIMESSGGAIVEGPALTNGQLLIGSTGTAPVAAALTAGSNIAITNGAGTITVGLTGVVPVANGGTNSGTALNSNRIMVSSAGAIVEAAALTNGQLLIGSTGAAPMVAPMTAGFGIIITNAAGSITITKATIYSSGTGTTGDTFSQVFTTSNAGGMSTIFSIRNTGGTNGLTLQVSYTNIFGASNSITVNVAAGGFQVIDSHATLPGAADPPPYTTLTYSVKSQVAGNATNFSWFHSTF